MQSNSESQLKVILAFVAIYVIWGTTYIGIAFGLDGFPPFVFCAFRFFIAGLLLFLYSRAKNNRVPPGKILFLSSVSGTVALVGGSGLVTWAEQYVGPGHAATIIAAEPFMFILFERKMWSYYFSQKTVIAGLLVGFAGLVLFSSASVPEAGKQQMQLVGNLVLILSAVLWVLGSLSGKKVNTEAYSNTMITSIQLMAAGVFSALLALITGEWGRFSFSAVSAASWGGLVYMITMGSMVAFLAFTWLMTIRPPALVSTHTYVNPVVAVFTGWLLAGETFSYLQVIGLAIILLGVLLTKFPEYRNVRLFSK